jgi:hypothetical protein
MLVAETVLTLDAHVAFDLRRNTAAEPADKYAGEGIDQDTFAWRAQKYMARYLSPDRENGAPPIVLGQTKMEILNQ